MRFDARQIAGLCNGSTPDSDSVCEGSNPSPAAKNRLSIGQPVFLWFLYFLDCQRIVKPKCYGGKKSVKGNRQGFLSRQITRRSGRIAKSCYKILFCNSESSLSKESKGAVASSQCPAGSQATHSEFEIPSHIVPAASPPGLFPFTALHIIENYGMFSVKY